MRPWHIWWDFSYELEAEEPSHIIIQTNHPKYTKVPYLLRFEIAQCEDEDGSLDHWVQNWFEPFVDDICSGRKSLHKIMR